MLEAHARDVAGMVALDKAAALGKHITHTTAFVDNTTAESVAERGKTSTEMLNALNLLRLMLIHTSTTSQSHDCGGSSLGGAPFLDKAFHPPTPSQAI